MGIISETIEKNWGKPAGDAYRDYVVRIIADLEDNRDIMARERALAITGKYRLEDRVSSLQRANDSLEKQRRTAWASDKRLQAEIDRLRELLVFYGIDG